MSLTFYHLNDLDIFAEPRRSGKVEHPVGACPEEEDCVCVGEGGGATGGHALGVGVTNHSLAWKEVASQYY